MKNQFYYLTNTSWRLSHFDFPLLFCGVHTNLELIIAMREHRSLVVGKRLRDVDDVDDQQGGGAETGFPEVGGHDGDVVGAGGLEVERGGRGDDALLGVDAEEVLADPPATPGDVEEDQAVPVAGEVRVVGEDAGDRHAGRRVLHDRGVVHRHRRQPLQLLVQLRQCLDVHQL